MATPAAPAPASAPAPQAGAAPAQVQPQAKPAAPAPNQPPPPAANIPIGFAPTKPGEPPFQLKLDPQDKFTFKGDNLSEGVTTIDVKLTNPTNARQTFKVKCTSNEIFRVRPPLGFCDVNETVTIKISFGSKTVPVSARHFFAFYHMKSDEKNKTARQVWTPQSKAEGVRRILAFFEKNDGTPAATLPSPAAPPAAPPQAKAPAAGAPAPQGAPAPAAAPAAPPPAAAPAQPAPAAQK